MAVRFAFELLDKISGPASKIDRQLAKVEAGLQANAKAMAALDGKTDKASLKTVKSLEKQNALFHKQKEQLLKGGVAVASKIAGEEKLASKMEKGGQKAKEQGSALSQLAGFATKAWVAMKALSFVSDGVRLVAGMRQFKEQTQEALKFSLGSSKASQEAYGEILRISNVLGASSAEAAANFRELTAAGFGDRESKILLQLADDLKAANGGQAVALSSLAEPLQALKRNELLTADSFKGLEAAGMGRDRLYKVLAQQLKVAVKDPNDTNAIKRDVDRALASQQLRGQKAVDFWAKVNMAALDVTALGQKGQGFRASTVTGSLDLVKNKMESLLAAVNDSNAGKALVANLQRLATALDPTTEGGKRLLGILDGIADSATSLLETLSPLSEGLGQGFGEAYDTVAEVLALFDDGKGKSANFGDALRTIGVALGYVVVGTGAAIGGLMWLVGFLGKIAAFIVGAAGAIGVALVEGIVGGLDGAKAKLIARLETLAQLLPDSVRKLLKIQSPSRVFMQIGAHTAEGLAEGIEGGERRVERSAEALATSAVRGGAQPTGQGGGQRPTVTLPAGLVQVTINGAADLDEVERRVQEGILRAFREMGFELGVPALWASPSSFRAPALSTTRRGWARTGIPPSSTGPRCPAW